jgi:hypothetical protein
VPRRPIARTSLLASAAVALVLGATGCGDSGTATTAAAKDDPTVARAGGDGVLELGRGAVAAFVDYGTSNRSRKTKVGVRVHEVRKGRIADFEGFDLEPAQRRAVPYYVDATFENRGSFALSRNLLRASLEDTDGREYRPTTLVVLGGSFRRCPQAGRAVLDPGGSFDGCSVVLLPEDARPGRVRFQGDVTEDPVYWKTGS